MMRKIILGFVIFLLLINVFVVSGSEIAVGVLPRTSTTMQGTNTLVATAKSYDTSSTWASAFGATINTAAGGRSMLDILKSPEELRAQRAEFDRNLQGLIMPHSTEYYMSQVCDSNIPAPKDGYAYVQDNRGMIRTAAHVSGEKQFYREFNETEDGRIIESNKYLYRLSYTATNYNIDNVTIRFRVTMRDPGVKEMVEIHELKMGQEKSDLIVNISDVNYDRVCIEFVGTVPRAGAYLLPADNYRQVQNPFCNRIQFVGGESTHYSMPRHLR